MKTSASVPEAMEPNEPAGVPEAQEPNEPMGTKKSMPANKPKVAKKKNGITSIDDLKAAAAKFPAKKLGGGYRG